MSDVIIVGSNYAGIAAAFELQSRLPDSDKATVLKSFYFMDTGANGLFMSLGSQPWLNMQLNIPGPWSHWAKIIAEKYQM